MNNVSCSSTFVVFGPELIASYDNKSSGCKYTTKLRLVVVVVVVNLH